MLGGTEFRKTEGFEALVADNNGTTPQVQSHFNCHKNNKAIIDKRITNTQQNTKIFFYPKQVTSKMERTVIYLANIHITHIYHFRNSLSQPSHMELSPGNLGSLCPSSTTSWVIIPIHKFLYIVKSTGIILLSIYSQKQTFVSTCFKIS